MTQNNLATAYRGRIRGERADNLEQAIAASTLALQVYTREAFPQQWAMTQNNLAIAYLYRIRGERADNLEQAIAASTLALQVYTREAFPQEWAMTQNNLATAYRDRIRGERADNLEQAIAAYQLALQVRTREAFPVDWAMTQNNLATAYRERIRGERADNLEQAIAASTLALQVYTRKTFPQDWAMTQNNLATAYRERIRGERADNLEQALAAYHLALQVYTPEAFPQKCRMTARNLGNLHFEQQAWSKAASAYTLALQANEILVQSAIFLDGKAAELAETSDLPRRAAYALARSSNLQAAALTLEQGCARGLSETLERDRADLTQLQQLVPALYTQYADTTTQLRNLETQQRLRMLSDERHSLTPNALRTEALRLRQTLTETIDQIRQVPGYEDFLAQPSFEDIRQALRPGIPFVYLVPTSAGSLALVVTQDTITPIWLNDITEAQLQELVQNWLSAYSQSQSDRAAWFDVIDQGTAQLWQLMQPIISHLQTQNIQTATLIPTGVFTLLPLHAAWTEEYVELPIHEMQIAKESVLVDGIDESNQQNDVYFSANFDAFPSRRRYALDYIHFTYAPNASSIAHSETVSQKVLADSLLVIDNPTQDLPGSSYEASAAIAAFPKYTLLQHEAASVEAVLKALPAHNVIHFSGHANVNMRESLASVMIMSNGTITVRDLLDLRSTDIRLVILSACETGLLGIESMDEVMSLSTAFLQVGAAGVIASLWSPPDLSTMLLFIRFYDLLGNGLSASLSLRQAQQWLRDSSNSELEIYIKSMTITISPTIQMNLRRAWRNSSTNPFAHPFYWAAFHYTGV
jgi:CHAT domain-containing protein